MVKITLWLKKAQAAENSLGVSCKNRRSAHNKKTHKKGADSSSDLSGRSFVEAAQPSQPSPQPAILPGGKGLVFNGRNIKEKKYVQKKLKVVSTFCQKSKRRDEAEMRNIPFLINLHRLSWCHCDPGSVLHRCRCRYC